MSVAEWQMMHGRRIGQVEGCFDRLLYRLLSDDPLCQGAIALRASRE
jgi:hypothetical protein